jgi:hypothetical protein
MSVETELGAIQIEIAVPLLSLARKLRLADSPEPALAAVEEADSSLDAWETRQHAVKDSPGRINFPFGVVVGLPLSFDATHRNE